METNKYENTYVSVYKAKCNVDKLCSVVEFLKNMDRPATCAEIGKFVFGGQYQHSYLSASYRTRMGQMLKHLKEGGFVKCEEVPDGEPITVECWGRLPENYGVPEIRVTDDYGNVYYIPNPNYKNNAPTWGNYTKTIQPTKKLWSWVGD